MHTFDYGRAIITQSVLELQGPGGPALLVLRCREKVGLKGAGFRPPSLVYMSSVFSAYMLASTYLMNFDI